MGFFFHELLPGVFIPSIDSSEQAQRHGKDKNGRTLHQPERYLGGFYQIPVVDLFNIHIIYLFFMKMKYRKIEEIEYGFY